MCICGCMLCEFRSPQGQKKSSDALLPELQVVVSRPILVLETELKPPRKAVRAFHCSASSPAAHPCWWAREWHWDCTRSKVESVPCVNVALGSIPTTEGKQKPNKRKFAQAHSSSRESDRTGFSFEPSQICKILKCHISKGNWGLKSKGPLKHSSWDPVSRETVWLELEKCTAH